MGTEEPLHGNGAPDTSAGPTRVRYQVLAVGCTMYLLSYLDRFGFSFFAKSIGRDFSLDDQHQGFLATAFLIAYGGCQIPAGLAGDRFGARLLLTIFVVGWSVATAALAFVPAPQTFVWLPLAVLLALRFMFGVFQSGAFAVFTRTLADWTPVSERATAQGILWTTSRLGALFSVFFVAWLLELYDGWRLPLVILGGLGIVWSLVFFPWFRNLPEQMPQVNEDERRLIRTGQPPVQGPTPPPPWRRILRSRSFWCLCLMYGGCGPAGNFVLQLLAYYLMSHRNLPEESAKDTAKWILGAVLTVGFLACTFGGRVSDTLIRRLGRRWGRSLNGLFGLTLAGFAFASISAVDNIWLLAAVLCIVQFGNDFSMGPAWAAAAEIGDRYAGTVSGAMNMTSNCIGAVALSLAGTLMKDGHADWMFIAFGGSYVFAGLCWLGIDVTKPVTADEVAAG